METKTSTNYELKVKKAFWQMILATITLIVGLGLLIASFICPPLGDISASVLTAFGEALSFVDAVIGIDYSYKKKKLEYEHVDEE